MPELRVAALYPDLMNIYADRGNLALLEHRCEWRGIGFRVQGIGLGETLDPVAHDLVYMGGGQDRDQRLCAEDLVATKREALHAAADRGAVVLAVCGGYQLLGHGYELDGEELPGVGLVDVRTVRDDGPRLIGNVAIEVELDPGDRRVPAGFENHGGRTALGPAAQPLGRVLRGFGNDGRSGYEGVRRANVIGTYLHGPLLPKNAWLADWLIATALGGDVTLGTSGRPSRGRGTPLPRAAAGVWREASRHDRGPCDEPPQAPRAQAAQPAASSADPPRTAFAARPARWMRASQASPATQSVTATKKFRRSPRTWWAGSTRSSSSKMRKAE